MNKQKRPLTLAGAILNIIGYSVNIVATGYAIFATWLVLSIALDLGASGDESVTLMSTLIGTLIGYVIRIALSITSIVLSAKAIKISKMSIEDFETKKKTLWALYIINLVLVFYGLFSLGMSLDTVTIYILIDAVIWILLGLAALFFALDLGKNKKAADAQKIATTQSAPVVEETKKDSEENTIEKLSELNKMKEDGLITEEEYNNMKSDLLK